MMSFSYRAKLSKKLNKCTYRPIWSEFCADPYMRKLCVSPQKNTPNSTDPRLLLQLAGIGNNINQIARNLNIQLKTTNLTDNEVKKLDNTLQVILQELRTLRGGVC